MVDLINFDKFQLARLKDNTIAALECNVWVSFNDVERCVRAKFEKPQLISLLFDFRTVETGIVKVKANFFSDKLEALGEDYIAQYVCHWNICDVNDIFFGYDAKNDSFVSKKICRAEIFKDVIDIRELIDSMIAAINSFSHCDVILEEEDNEINYGDER